MGFLSRVEAAILKPRKINRVQKSKKKSKEAIKPKKATPIKPIKPAASTGAEKVTFSDLTNTRKLTKFIEKELQLTDPFNFTNETWARFTKKVAPKLLTALLLDMNIVPKARRAEFGRYLSSRLRTLSKT